MLLENYVSREVYSIKRQISQASIILYKDSYE